MIKTIISIFVACMGYSIVFNVNLKKIVYASINCCFGYAVYQLCQPLGNYVALVISSFVITFVSELLARFSKTPVTVYLVCALIPLVPGMGAYYTVLYILNGLKNLALSRGLDTLVQAGSIVVGVSFASNLFKAFSSLKKH